MLLSFIQQQDTGKGENSGDSDCNACANEWLTLLNTKHTKPLTGCRWALHVQKKQNVPRDIRESHSGQQGCVPASCDGSASPTRKGQGTSARPRNDIAEEVLGAEWSNASPQGRPRPPQSLIRVSKVSYGNVARILLISLFCKK